MVFLLIVGGALTLAIGGSEASWRFVVAAAILSVALVGMLIAMAVFRWRLVHLLAGQAPGVLSAVPPRHFGQLPAASAGHSAQLVKLAGRGRTPLFGDRGSGGRRQPWAGHTCSRGQTPLLTLIPLTPGGLGLVEPGMVGLLMVSLPRADALPVALLDRAISFLSLADSRRCGLPRLPVAQTTAGRPPVQVRPTGVNYPLHCQLLPTGQLARGRLSRLALSPARPPRAVGNAARLLPRGRPASGLP